MRRARAKSYTYDTTVFSDNGIQSQSASSIAVTTAVTITVIDSARSKTCEHYKRQPWDSGGDRSTYRRTRSGFFFIRVFILISRGWTGLKELGIRSLFERTPSRIDGACRAGWVCRKFNGLLRGRVFIQEHCDRCPPYVQPLTRCWPDPAAAQYGPDSQERATRDRVNYVQRHWLHNISVENICQAI